MFGICLKVIQFFHKNRLFLFRIFFKFIQANAWMNHHCYKFNYWEYQQTFLLRLLINKLGYERIQYNLLFASQHFPCIFVSIEGFLILSKILLKTAKSSSSFIFFVTLCIYFFDSLHIFLWFWKLIYNPFDLMRFWSKEKWI